MATSQNKLSFWVWLIIGILVLALLLPLIVKIGGGYYRWGFGKSTKVASSECLECPQCPEVPVATQPATDYNCIAVDLGDGGPVGQAGSCSFCTINYTYPGDVFIAEDTPIEYSADAWVWQYTRGDLAGFRECIQGQDFHSDPNYTPVWP
jgi:hypothetical protein